MSDIPGNPYAKALDSHHLGSLEANATLALAYEQRTANLIAAMQPVNFPDGASVSLTIEKCAQIHNEIGQRLGLTE